MRVDVLKLIFIGAEKDRPSFFQRAQEWGLIEFIQNEEVRLAEVPQEVQHFNRALKILGTQPPTEQEEETSSASADALAKEILHYHEEKESAEEQVRLLQLEMARVRIFGNFNLEDLAFIEQGSDYKVRFFCAKHSKELPLEISESLIFVGEDHGLDHFVAISRDFKAQAPLIEMFIDRPLNQLQADFEAAKTRLAKAERELHALEKWKSFIAQALLEVTDRYHLTEANYKANSNLEQRLFSCQGWAPKNKLNALRELAIASDVYIEQVKIEEEDRIPTYLENQSIAKIGEDLVEVYDTPSNSDKDPSLWVFFSFLLFFALIVGDAGYGLIYLLIALYLGFKNKPSTLKGKRVFKLAVMLSSATILIGLFSNSFFGLSLDIDNPLMQVSLKQRLIERKASYHLQHKDDTYAFWLKKFPQLKEAKTGAEALQLASICSKGSRQYEMNDKFADQIMLDLALFIGCIHLILSFIRYLDRNYSGWGWIAFIIGGYLYFPEYLQATSFAHFVFNLDSQKAAEAGMQLMMSGMCFALLLSILQHRLSGLLEVMNLLQVFGDVLSYIRIYALGMAGSIVASTINDMASSVGIVLALVILILGHGMNIILGVMGGVIHGLRLNFLEFYHYSFEGGGRKFQPLKLFSKKEEAPS